MWKSFDGKSYINPGQRISVIERVKRVRSYASRVIELVASLITMKSCNERTRHALLVVLSKMNNGKQRSGTL